MFETIKTESIKITGKWKRIFIISSNFACIIKTKNVANQNIKHQIIVIINDNELLLIWKLNLFRFVASFKYQIINIELYILNYI